MQNGKKVFHRYFASNEYIYMKGDWIYDEDGYYYDPDEWWSFRSAIGFETGWYIFDY